MRVMSPNALSKAFITLWAYSTVMTDGIWSIAVVLEVVDVAIDVDVGAAAVVEGGAAEPPLDEHPAAATAPTATRTATARSRPTHLTLPIPARTVLIPAQDNTKCYNKER